MRKTCAARLLNVLNASDSEGWSKSALDKLSPYETAFLFHDWDVWARDDQLAPLFAGASDSRSSSRPEARACADGGATADVHGGRLPREGTSKWSDEGESLCAKQKWRVWVVLGGRGSGKTRTGAEWVRAQALNREGEQKKPARIALVGKTIADVRNVMIEGVSGLLAVHAPRERPLFEPSKRRISWKNGAVAEMFSADEREGLRGPQFTHAWVDELAKWREGEKAWDLLQFGLRLGVSPQCVVTTTPRPHAYLKKIMSDAATVVTRLATADNATNLAPAFLAEMTRRYAGTFVGRQELLGEVVEDGLESLWRRAWIESARVECAPEMARVVVALDPPVTATIASDACGIVVAGLGVDGRAYVLADRTVQGRTPDVWARAALAAFDDYEADRMVAEVNQGGDLVVGVLQQFRENFPVTKVHATRGKWVRAEPVAALYAEGRVVHVGVFGDLEAQMCAFGSDGRVGGKSPDRVDALVWALTDLMLGDETRPKVRMI